MSRPGREHQDLRALLASLGRATGTARERLLHELQVLLDEHFRDEEGAGGLFERAHRRAPEQLLRLEALRAEHLDLSAEAVALLHHPDPVREAAFVEALAAHEREEARVLVEVLGEPGSGPGDP